MNQSSAPGPRVVLSRSADFASIFLTRRARSVAGLRGPRGRDLGRKPTISPANILVLYYHRHGRTGAARELEALSSRSVVLPPLPARSRPGRSST